MVLFQVDGFFTLVFGLSSIYTLTVISFTRYIKGCHSTRGLGLAELISVLSESRLEDASDPVALSCVSAHRITRSSVFVSLLCIWVTAVFWSAAPLLGWGSYTGRNPVLIQTHLRHCPSPLLLCRSGVRYL